MRWLRCFCLSAVDRRSPSGPDPSSERAHHQPCQPAMRAQPRVWWEASHEAGRSRRPELRKESIILPSRPLRHHLLPHLNCYKTIPGIAGASGALWRHGEAVGTQGGADLHHTTKVAMDSEAQTNSLLWFGLIAFPPLGTSKQQGGQRNNKEMQRKLIYSCWYFCNCW